MEVSRNPAELCFPDTFHQETLSNVQTMEQFLLPDKWTLPPMRIYHLDLEVTLKSRRPQYIGLHKSPFWSHHTDGQKWVTIRYCPKVFRKPQDLRPSMTGRLWELPTAAHWSEGPGSWWSCELCTSLEFPFSLEWILCVHACACMCTCARVCTDWVKSNWRRWQSGSSRS